MLEKFINTDKELTLFLNSFHNIFFDTLMYYISNKFVAIPLYLLLLYYIIKQYKDLKKVIIFLITVAVLVLITDQVSVHLFKNVFQRLRPCHCAEIKNIIHTVNGKCGGKFGFISSHATNIFGISIFMYKVFNNKYIKVLLLFWALLVSYSRIYLGVHYFGDVLFGAVTGSLIAMMIYHFYKKIILTNNTNLN
jgi:undecaprenyl-diphosphatase